jgi:hypothetical protein
MSQTGKNKADNKAKAGTTDAAKTTTATTSANVENTNEGTEGTTATGTEGTTATGTDANAGTEGTGTEGTGTEGTGTEGTGTEGTGTEGTGTEGTGTDAKGTEGAGTQPAAPAATGTIKATKKQPPLKNGARAGRGGGTRIGGGKPTYNFAEAAYGDVTGFLRHIANGCYVPVFNGYPGYPEQFDAAGKPLPKYATLEEAAKANAVIFGYRTDLPHFIGYKQNTQLEKAGVTQLTSLPEQKYHCFLTATSLEDIAKAKANIAAYEAMPWNANSKSMVSKWLAEPYNLTFPAAPALLGTVAAPAAPAADATAADATAKVEGETATA